MSHVMLRHEYWFCPNGTILLADSVDTHIAHALRAATQQLVQCLRKSPCYGAPALADVLERCDGTDAVALRTTLLDTTDAWARNDKRWQRSADDVDKYLSRCGVLRATQRALFNSDYCPRTWASRYCGWLHIRDAHASMYQITSANLRLLRDGLWDAWNQEAGGDLHKPDDDVTWTLYDEKRKRTATMTWAEMQSATTFNLHWRTARMQAALPGG